MLFLAWLSIGGGAFLSYAAVANRNPYALIEAWFKGVKAPEKDWFPLPVLNPIPGVGGAVGGAVADAVGGQQGMGINPANLKYKNLGVLDYVQRAAEVFGRKYGIGTIGGYRANDVVQGSDHPKRKAIDMMTSDYTKGSALAADLVANHKAYRVKYVIWWHRIWQPETGWQPYTGTSNPHTDHVHVSFY